MRNNPPAYSKMAVAIFTFTLVTCSVVFLSPTYAKTKKSKLVTAVASPQPSAPTTPETLESGQLVQRLIADRLVDESKGFVIEKKQNLLFINGVEQPSAIANKYLANIMQTDIRVQVFSFRERLQMHPDAGIMELISPVWSSSGCVQYAAPKKPGC